MINKIIDLLYSKDDVNIELAYHLLDGKIEEITTDKLIKHYKERIEECEYLNVDALSVYIRDLKNRYENKLKNFFSDDNALKFYRSLDRNIRFADNSGYGWNNNIGIGYKGISFILGAHIRTEHMSNDVKRYSIKSNRDIINITSIAGNEDLIEETQKNLNYILDFTKNNIFKLYYDESKDEIKNLMKVLVFILHIDKELCGINYIMRKESAKSKLINTLKKGNFPILYGSPENHFQVEILSYNNKRNTCKTVESKYDYYSYTRKCGLTSKRKIENRDVGILFNKIKNFIPLD